MLTIKEMRHQISAMITDYYRSFNWMYGHLQDHVVLARFAQTRIFLEGNDVVIYTVYECDAGRTEIRIPEKNLYAREGAIKETVDRLLGMIPGVESGEDE